MKVVLDEEAEAAMIYLTEIGPGDSKHSCPVECDALRGEVFLDINGHGQLIVIEVLGASTALTPDVLASAQTIGLPRFKVVRHGSRKRRGRPC